MRGLPLEMRGPPDRGPGGMHGPPDRGPGGMHGPPDRGPGGMHGPPGPEQREFRGPPQDGPRIPSDMRGNIITMNLKYNQLPLRWTCSGPAPTVCLREVSALEGDEVND